MKLNPTYQDALFTKQYDWILIHDFLKTKHISVPRIYKIHPESQCLLLEDCSDFTLQTLCSHELASSYYKSYSKKIHELLLSFLCFEKNSQHLWAQRSFDQTLLEKELSFLFDHRTQDVHPLFSDKELTHLQSESRHLAQSLAAESHYFCHRDFHSRNMLQTPQRSHLYLIDFQDARLGSASYDLISFAFDPYLPASWEERMGFIHHFKRILLPHENLHADFHKSFDRTFLQRCLKIIGSYFYLQTHNPTRHYIKHIPLVLEFMLTFVPFTSLAKTYPFLSHIFPLRMYEARHTFEAKN
jgi:aminoglycoside/choline kinase family phosphotransferase